MAGCSGAIETPCITIDSRSSQQSTTLAHNIISSGAADVVMACGVENMTWVPIGSDAIPANKKMGKPVGRSYLSSANSPASSKPQRLAEKYQRDPIRHRITACNRKLAKAAIENGHFDSQIIAIKPLKWMTISNARTRY